MLEVTAKYCQSLDLPDITFCKNDGPTSTPKIEVTFAKSFKFLPCSPSDCSIYTPILHNPDHRILATVEKKKDKDSAIVIVNGKNAPNELIQNAKGWDKVYSSSDGPASAFRPKCDDGFLSVSDIFVVVITLIVLVIFH